MDVEVLEVGVALVFHGQVSTRIDPGRRGYNGERYIIRARGIRFTDRWVIEVRAASEDPFGKPIQSIEVVGAQAALQAADELKNQIREGQVDLTRP